MSANLFDHSVILQIVQGIIVKGTVQVIWRVTKQRHTDTQKKKPHKIHTHTHTKYTHTHTHKVHAHMHTCLLVVALGIETMTPLWFVEHLK